MKKLRLESLEINSFRTTHKTLLTGGGTWVCTEEACTNLGLCPTVFCETADVGCESVEFCPTGNLPCDQYQ